MGIEEQLKEKALQLGFDFAGLGVARPAPHAQALVDWLAEGCHGDMHWMGRDPGRRADPRLYVPGTRTVLTVGLSYHSEPLPPAWRDDPGRGRIAAYAWGPDYHTVMTPMLKELAAEADRLLAPATPSRWAVDTAPVLEREAAAGSGQGFIGRHTQFIHPQWGSCVWLAEVLIARELVPDPAGAPDPHRGCGTCMRCLDACPPGALTGPYRLDARRCISYLTMEHRGAVDPALRQRMGRWIFGCDECQSACPWTRAHARRGAQRFLRLDPDLAAPPLDGLLALDAAAFKARYHGTPIARAGLPRLRRNVCTAMGNSGLTSFIPVLQPALSDPDPAVREHAAWALHRLGTPTRPDPPSA